MSLSIVARLVAVMALGVTISARAQEADPVVNYIEDMLKMHQEKTLCVDKDASVQAMRNQLIAFLRAAGVQGSVPPKALAVAMWSLYPCPFSPIRKELRPAGEKDIEGVWLFPESSQKLRFPPLSQHQSPAGVKCDAVGYYPGGELRHAVIAGNAARCPFSKAADFEVARRNPRVATWNVFRSARVRVTRTDVQNHIEEWEVFSVVTPFTFHEIDFSPGDLVAYIRKENGNDFNVATQFRHLKRLPTE